LLIIIIVLSIVFIAGCTQSAHKNQSNQTSNNYKPTFYCKNNQSLREELLYNCTDSFLMQETASEIMKASFDITRKNDNCHVVYSIDKSVDPKFENTSMTCDFPIINGEYINGIGLEYCEGSYKDNLLQPNNTST
jgi:hypothetical protein